MLVKHRFQDSIRIRSRDTQGNNEVIINVCNDDAPFNATKDGSFIKLGNSKIPINPNTIVLPNSIEGRLFYDQGWTSTPSLALKSFGAGFNLPLGGDVVGVGPVSLTNITLLAVLWKKVDDTESQDPTILFDFTGEL